MKLQVNIINRAFVFATYVMVCFSCYHGRYETSYYEDLGLELSYDDKELKQFIIRSPSREVQDTIYFQTPVVNENCSRRFLILIPPDRLYFNSSDCWLISARLHNYKLGIIGTCPETFDLIGSTSRDTTEIILLNPSDSLFVYSDEPWIIQKPYYKIGYLGGLRVISSETGHELPKQIKRRPTSF